MELANSHASWLLGSRRTPVESAQPTAAGPREVHVAQQRAGGHSGSCGCTRAGQMGTPSSRAAQSRRGWAAGGRLERACSHREEPPCWGKPYSLGASIIGRTVRALGQLDHKRHEHHVATDAEHAVCRLAGRTVGFATLGLLASLSFRKASQP